MAHKLLYVEDLDPSSIVSDLKTNGFEVEHYNPNTFENLVDTLNTASFDALILDFRLTKGEGHAKFDAPTIAQLQRTNSVLSGRNFPIILVSSEANISDYYEDFTSNDLFDFSLSKEVLQSDFPKYSQLIRDFIDSYITIEREKFDIAKILSVSDVSVLDYRFIEKTSDRHFNSNTYRLSRLINLTLVRSIGPLFGEDVLSAKLGISKKSKGWQDLISLFDAALYNGIFSGSYKRWWTVTFDKICAEKLKVQSLRRLPSTERLKVFRKLGINELELVEKLEFAESTNYWTICKALKTPIDPIDGLELISMRSAPWSDKEYISILAAMKSHPLKDALKPSELARFQEFAKTVN